MLETDCAIPTEFVPIKQPETYTLYGIEHAVDVMRQQGYKKWQICQKLRIGDDAWRDAIFEIRKKEMVEDMARGKRLTEEQQKRIQMLRQAGATLGEIAGEIGCQRQTVAKALRGYKSDAAQDAPECAQSAPAAVTAQVTGDVPEAVREAVRDSVSTLSTAIDIKLMQIKRMQQEIEAERTKIAELKNWLKEVENGDGYQIDDPPATD